MTAVSSPPVRIASSVAPNERPSQVIGGKWAETVVATADKLSAAEEPQLALAQALYADRRHSIAAICTTLRVSRSTLYRYIRAVREPPATGSTQ